MNIGDYVAFEYREIENDPKSKSFGKPRLTDYAGYVTGVTKRGQFTVSPDSVNVGARFEKCAVVRWY